MVWLAIMFTSLSAVMAITAWEVHSEELHDKLLSFTEKAALRREITAYTFASLATGMLAAGLWLRV